MTWISVCPHGALVEWTHIHGHPVPNCTQHEARRVELLRGY